jgi:hypothetical protein
MSISVRHNRPTICAGFRPGRSGDPAGRLIRRLGILAVLPAKRSETTPGNDRNDRNGAPSKFDTTTGVAVHTIMATAGHHDGDGGRHHDEAIDNATTAVIDTSIAGGGRNSLFATDAFAAKQY